MSESKTKYSSEELKAFLAETVRQHYLDSGNGILLANLGWALFHKRPELRNSMGRRKIGEFLVQEMSDQIQVSPSPNDPAVKIAAPNPALQVIAQQMQNFNQPASATEPRRAYARAALLAFSRPLLSGLQRTLTLQPTVYFDDIPTDRDMPKGSYHIESEFIVESNKIYDIEPVFDEKVDQWLKKNNLPIELLLRHKKKLACAKKMAPSNALDLMLSELSDADLRRIQMPLDIIAKLQKMIY